MPTFTNRGEFIAYLEQTLIPDLRDAGRGETANDFETAIRFMVAGGRPEHCSNCHDRRGGCDMCSESGWPVDNESQKTTNQADAMMDSINAGDYDAAEDAMGQTECPEGCEVEPDGKCPHGYESLGLRMGLI